MNRLAKVEFSERPDIIDNSWEVTTPENIAFQYRLAGPFRRLFAFLIDVFLTQFCYWVLAGIALWIGISAVTVFDLGNTVIGQFLFGAVYFALMVGSFLATWFYGAICETYLNGQTIGKKWMSLRVLSAEGSSIDGSQAVLRNFFRLFDSMPLAPAAWLFGVNDPELAVVPIPTFVLGLVLMTINRRFQRVGDLVAGTVVVSEEGQHLVQLNKLENFEAARELAEQLPADFVYSQSLLRALAAYANRRSHLGRDRALEIAGRIAEPLVKKLDIAENTDRDLLLCALYYRGFFGETIRKGDAIRFSNANEK